MTSPVYQMGEKRRERQSDMDTILDELEEQLKMCTNYEKEHPYCKYGEACYRKDPSHKDDFAHLDDFKECTDIYLDMSYRVYKDNDDEFPNRWYNIIDEFLKEHDFTKQDSLYFNIMGNICEHMDEYVKRFGKRFIALILMRQEEQAVTGMFPVSLKGRISRCLKKLGSPDTRYLSNTALTISSALR